MKIDMHVHTSRSYDCGLQLSAIIKKTKECGFNGFCIMDHNQIFDDISFIESARKEGIMVFTGMEYSSAQGHLLL